MSGVSTMLGAIEAGGTKFVCAIGHGTQVVDRCSIPTERPDETLDAAAAFFDGAAVRHGRISAVGIGAFGPIQINPKHLEYGRILETPKAGWSGFNIRDGIQHRLGVPTAVDTDVNCALIGEMAFGAGRGAAAVAYFTVGTGIGGALVHNGTILRGWGHSEMGHMFIPRHTSDPASFGGACPFHADQCAEGLASGPALTMRLGAPLHEAPPDHAIWALAAEYLATICLNITMIAMPERIILGGGVMSQTHLFPAIRQRLWAQCGGYLKSGLTHAQLDQLIVPSGLDGNAGIIGALQLASQLR